MQELARESAESTGEQQPVVPTIPKKTVVPLLEQRMERFSRHKRSIGPSDFWRTPYLHGVI